MEFAEKDAAGNAYDVGYMGVFVGGRTSDGHLAGFMTSKFVEEPPAPATRRGVSAEPSPTHNIVAISTS